jgi:hypothetical protein
VGFVVWVIVAAEKNWCFAMILSVKFGRSKKIFGFWAKSKLSGLKNSLNKFLSREFLTTEDP